MRYSRLHRCRLVSPTLSISLFAALAAFPACAQGGVATHDEMERAKAALAEALKREQAGGGDPGPVHTETARSSASPAAATVIPGSEGPKPPSEVTVAQSRQPNPRSRSPSLRLPRPNIPPPRVHSRRNRRRLCGSDRRSRKRSLLLAKCMRSAQGSHTESRMRPGGWMSPSRPALCRREIRDLQRTLRPLYGLPI
jgi:hypothetical protein